MHTKLLICLLLYTIASALFICGGFLSIYGYYVLPVCMLICMLFCSRSFFSTFLNRNCIPLYFFLLFFLIGSLFDLGWTVTIFVSFSTPLFCDFFVKEYSRISGNSKALEFFVFFVLLLFVFLSITTIKLLINDPLLLRKLAQEEGSTLVIGGCFALPYSMVILCPYLFHKLKDFHGIRKLFVLFVIILETAYVILSTYTTAILLLLFGYIYVFTRSLPRKRRIVIIILLGLSLLAIPIVLPFVIGLFSTGGGEADIVAIRLNELLEISQGVDASNAGRGDFGSRIDLSVSSILAFLQHPLFGIGPSVNFDYVELGKVGVGQHAEWLDNLAKYGLFSFLLIRYLYLYSKRNYNKNNVAIPLFVVLGFFNPILFFTIFFTAFFFVPITNIAFPKP